MTKREQYSLSFSKIKSPIDGSLVNVCKKNGVVNQYNTLQIIQQLDEFETTGLIEELDNALNGDYYEEYFSSDGVEDCSIQLNAPDVVFGENDLTISMVDLKVLLQEWLTFIGQ